MATREINWKGSGDINGDKGISEDINGDKGISEDINGDMFGTICKFINTMHMQISSKCFRNEKNSKSGLKVS